MTSIAHMLLAAVVTAITSPLFAAQASSTGSNSTNRIT